MTWTLKAANRVAQYGDISDEIAPDTVAPEAVAPDASTPAGEGIDTGNDDDDDDGDMEDIMPG